MANTTKKDLRILNIQGQDYELIPKKAAADEFGGIKADPKTTTENAEAKIGEDGKLYVNADTNGAAAAVSQALTAHASNENNPHKVTKAQIELGNVDNTSDADKPISTKTQEALNKKVDKVSGKGLSTNDYTTAEKNKLAGIAENANNLKIVPITLQSDSQGNYTISQADFDKIKRDDTLIIEYLGSFFVKNNYQQAGPDSDEEFFVFTSLYSPQPSDIYPMMMYISSKLTVILDQTDKLLTEAQKGIVNGLATLNDVGKVPTSQLPSYVDDIQLLGSELLVSKSYIVCNTPFSQERIITLVDANWNFKGDLFTNDAYNDYVFMAYTDREISNGQTEATIYFIGIRAVDNNSYEFYVIDNTILTHRIILSTSTNKTWRFARATSTEPAPYAIQHFCAEISPSIALGETSSTAYAGDKGKKNADDIANLRSTKADATTLNNYLPLSGGTMTGPITLKDADGQGILFGGKNSNINIVDNGTTKTLVGFWDNAFTLGHGSFNTKIRADNFTLVSNYAELTSGSSLKFNAGGDVIFNCPGNADLVISGVSTNTDYVALKASSPGRALFIQPNQHGCVNIGGTPSTTGKQDLSARLIVDGKAKVSEAPTEATDVVRKQELDAHTHNLHTKVTIPLTQMYIEDTNPHKLIIKSNIQDVNINGTTTVPMLNDIYQTKNAEAFKTSDGYKMTVEER